MNVKLLSPFLVVLSLSLIGFRESYAQISITSFAPTSGDVGTVVTIQGSGFDEAGPNNAVYIGTQRADVVAASSTQLTFEVPIGAPSVSPISVTNLITQRTTSTLVLQPAFFIVTYPGGRVGENTYKLSKSMVGDGPFSIVSGDFDGDNKIDIATANYNNNSVSVLIRNSQNTGFNTKIDFGVAPNPRMIVTADFNGDGKLDLATASNFTTNFISVLIRNSNPLELGGFTINNITTPYGLSALATGDINGDGLVDIITANYSSNNVSIFLRNATNTGFILSGNHAVGSIVTNVTVADFNGDGKLDVAASNWSTSNVSVLIRNSNNTGFNAVSNYAIDSNPRGIATGDFNGDGRSDLVVANHTGNSVSVLLRNSANNGFASAVHYPLGIYAQLVTVGDFNGDGKSDLLVNGMPNTDANQAMILLNEGGGTFQAPIKFSLTGLIRAMTTGDCNGDGMTDLIAVNNNGSNIILMESDLAMWKGGISDDWNLDANWWGKKAPTSFSETVVKECTVCPTLNSMETVRRLWTEDAILSINSQTLIVGEDAAFHNTTINNDGTIEATDITEFYNNTATGKLILKKTGGTDNVWSGNNKFKGEIQIINMSSRSISPSNNTSNLIQK